MNDIDWDAIFDEAEATPSARLAEIMARVDDIEFLVITFKTKGNEVHTTWSAADYILLLGAIHMSAESLHYSTFKEALREEGEF